MLLMHKQILYMFIKVSTQKNPIYFPPMESLRLFQDSLNERSKSWLLTF